MATKLPFDLQTNEEVLLLARRHWAFFAWEVGRRALVGLVPFVVVLVIVGMTTGFNTAGKVIDLVAALWLLWWLGQAGLAYYRYNHDIWVVTNQRIIDSAKRHPFNHRMASADLVDVEDIRINENGLFATMFNFGDLQLQTAGERENFLLSGIPDPTKVLALVDSRRDAARRDLGGFRT